MHTAFQHRTRIYVFGFVCIQKTNILTNINKIKHNNNNNAEYRLLYTVENLKLLKKKGTCTALM